MQHWWFRHVVNRLGWFHWGDRGQRLDGYLLVGRSRMDVKVRGCGWLGLGGLGMINVNLGGLRNRINWLDWGYLLHWVNVHVWDGGDT